MLNGDAQGEPIELHNGNAVSYTVPQKLRCENVEKVADVFFRVRRIFGASVINVTSGGQALASYKRERMAPGEMEHLLLPRRCFRRRPAKSPFPARRRIANEGTDLYRLPERLPPEGG